jgi:hypothetical protein
MLNIFCCDCFSVEPLQRTTLRADGALLRFELLSVRGLTTIFLVGVMNIEDL